MIQTLIGQKIDQTQKFLENGKRIPVTEVAIADNFVVQVKTVEKDAYTAVQLGWGTKKKPFKSASGHAGKAKLENVPTVLREVRLQDENDLPEVGSAVSLDTVFKAGDIIDVSGVSKGKGFAGGVKRYNFRGGPKTHGQSDRHRAPGSIGQGTTPGRVYKGKKMAGHMGDEEVTIKNLTVVDVDAENKKLYVLGLLPGTKKSTVVITVTGEVKNFVPLLKMEEEKTAVQEDVAGEQTQSEEVTEKAEAAKEEVQAEEQKADVKEEAPKEEIKAEEKQEVKAEESEKKEDVKEEKEDGK